LYALRILKIKVVYIFSKKLSPLPSSEAICPEYTAKVDVKS